MRILAALLLLALVISVSAQFGPTIHKCCDKHYSQAVPKNKVVSYFTTSSSCFLKAQVLETEAGREFCVNPHKAWVKAIVNMLDQKRNAAPASN